MHHEPTIRLSVTTRRPTGARRPGHHGLGTGRAGNARVVVTAVPATLAGPERTGWERIS
jgi:hypothetical protein